MKLQVSRLATLLKRNSKRRPLPVNIASFKNTYFEKHLRTVVSDSSYILHRILNKVIQEKDCPFASFET